MEMSIRFKTLTLAGLCLGLILAGCGRKGSLDDPASAASSVDPATNASLASEPVAPAEPRSDEPFFLDFLIQ